MSSAPPQAGWAMLWESQGVCDSPAAWKPQKFSLGRNAEASVSLQMLGPFVQHTLVQPQWEKYISLFQPAVFSSQSSPWILQMWIRAEHILLQNFCIYYTQVFPTSNVFLLAALTECSLVERKGKRTMKGFTCRYLYMSHMFHTCTNILILSALCFLHRELHNSYEFLNNVTTENCFLIMKK